MPRPSGASVWVFCPGAPTLWAVLPSNESDITREGDAAHWVGEQQLSGQTFMDVVELIDRQAPNGVFINEKMTDHVQMYVDHVCRNTSAPVIEGRVDIPEVCPGEPGTPDAYGWHAIEPGVMNVDDLKYGYLIVEAFENWQMMTYALGIYRAAVAAGHVITHFNLTIVQPRAPHNDGPVRSWLVSVDELQMLYWPRIIKAAQGGDCVTGPQCKRCDAAINCAALRQATAHASQYVAGPIAEEYDGHQLSVELDMLEAAAISLEARGNAIRTMAKDRAFEVSGSVPGWMIERAAGRNYWHNESSVPDLERVTGLDLHKHTPLTPNQAINDAGLDGKIVDQYTIRSIGKPKLVKHDPRAIMRKMGKQEKFVK